MPEVGQSKVMSRGRLGLEIGQETGYPEWQSLVLPQPQGALAQPV